MPALRIVTRIQDADDYGAVSDQEYLRLVNGQIIGGTPAGGVSAPLTLTLADAGTTTAAVVETLGHNSSNAPDVGFGTALKFQAKSLAGADQDAAQLAATWWDASGGSRLSVYVRQPGGSLAETFRLGGLQGANAFGSPPFQATISDMARWFDYGSQFRIEHEYWDSQLVDRWWFSVYPGPGTPSLTTPMRVGLGAVYEAPVLALAGLGVSFDDIGAQLTQTVASHQLALSLATTGFLYLSDGQFGAAIDVFYGAAFGFLARDNGSDVFQIRHTASILAGRDLEFSSNSAGTVYIDRTTGTKYRQYYDSGTLHTEIVP